MMKCKEHILPNRCEALPNAKHNFCHSLSIPCFPLHLKQIKEIYAHTSI